MARKKNALTKYEVSKTGEPEAFLQLGRYITEVNDTTEDTTEDFSDYAGDGTVSVDVTGVAEKYDFVGTYDGENEAMKFLAGLRNSTGEGRIIKFKITDPDGTIFEGPATVSNIIYRGGAASGYPVFSCTIRFNEAPEKTPAV